VLRSMDGHSESVTPSVTLEKNGGEIEISET